MGIRQDIIKEFIGGCLPIATGVFLGLLFCLLITLCGCKTQKETETQIERVEVPVPVIQEHTIENVRVDLIRDTLVRRDSVFHYIKGDTVVIERWHYTTNNNVKLRVDTIVKTEYVEKPVEVTKEVERTKVQVKEVEKKLHWYQKLLMAVGCIALLLGALGIAWKIGKRS